MPGQGDAALERDRARLAAIGYQGDVVMEPFVRMGGTIGREIKVWRQIVDQVTRPPWTTTRCGALQFSRFVLGRQ